MIFKYSFLLIMQFARESKQAKHLVITKGPGSPSPNLPYLLFSLKFELFSLNFEFAEINLKLAEGNESWGKNALLVDDAKRHLMVPLPQAAHSAVLRDFATTR